MATDPDTQSVETGFSDSSTLAPSADKSGFEWPSHYSFPPFFTLQPNIATRQAQLQTWSSLIQDYCQVHRLFRLSPSAMHSTSHPLFSNAQLRRRLALRDIQTVINYMTSPEGQWRAEWIQNTAATKKSKSAVDGSEKSEAWIYWRTPTEWASLVADWIDATGQKGQVLTVFEMTEGDISRGTEFKGMDADLLVKCLRVLEKRGKCAVFGEIGEEGVKFL